jgi:hypothetical protein
MIILALNNDFQSVLYFINMENIIERNSFNIDKVDLKTSLKIK